MPLTCSCDWDYGDYTWFYEPPEDYTVLATKRSRKCSCGTRIVVGDLCTKFRRWRHPKYDVEDRIYGDDGEIPLAPRFLCERCSDLYWSFSELGFECVGPDEIMPELVREYAATYGAKSATE